MGKIQSRSGKQNKTTSLMDELGRIKEAGTVESQPDPLGSVLKLLLS